jgi:hypothetical protein
MSFRQALHSLGLGQLAYQLWFKPIGRLRDMIAAGGPLEVRRTELGRREMEAAARTLPLLPGADDSAPLPLHLLTGRRFWYQTAFCLWSFARWSGRTLAPVIYDDGTLTAEYRQPLARLFAEARFVSQPETISRLDADLRAAKFPCLRERWQNYPNIRKLTDVHVGQSGWKLVLDSDLLFFHRPQFLLDWLEQPSRPLHAADCETSYGYPPATMDELAGARVAKLVNVGLTGLNGSALDWDRLEHWCRTLIERHGTSYYLEQALIAMLVAGRDCAIAPAADYVTKPDDDEGRACRAVMHHYVANSKKWYFRHCWRKTLPTQEAETRLDDL